MGRSILPLMVLCALGCELDDVAVPGALTVRTPVEGTVEVRGVRARLAGGEARELLAVGPPPYTVDFRHADGRLSVLEVEGPLIDLGGFLPGTRPVRGALVSVDFRAHPPTDEVVALVDDLVLRPARNGDLLRFELPAQTPVQVLALWREAGRASALHLREVAEPARSTGLELLLAPEVELDQRVGVAVRGEPAGRARVELTWAGHRTGVELGAGAVGFRAGERFGPSVPRPAPDAGLEPLGLWVEASAREVGEAAPRALVGAHLPLDTDEALLEWPAPVQVFPAPGGLVGSPLLRRAASSLGWSGDTRAASFADLRITARGACGPAETWRVVFPADAGEVDLPVPALGPDPLAAPLLEGRLELVELDLSYDEVFGDRAVDRSRLPRRSAREARRASVGAWRGGEASCVESPHVGRYAVYPLSDPGCVAGRVAPEVVVTRCGDIAPLSEQGAAARLTCARLAAATAEVNGAQWSLEARDGGALRLSSGEEGAWLLPLPEARVALPPALARQWSAVGLTEQVFEAIDGVPRTALDDVQVLIPRGTRGGPWLSLDRAGRLRFDTPELAFEADVLAFDGATGTARVRAPGCREEVRLLAVEVEGETLRLTEQVALARDRVLVREIVVEP